MKISIVGLGKMGSLVQKTAQEENIEIASSIDPHQKDADFSEIDEKSLHGTDVCICFTQPTAARKYEKDFLKKKSWLLFGSCSKLELSLQWFTP